MIRVFHVIDSLGNGGAEHQLAAMLVRSDSRRFQHTVCALGRADWNGATIRAAGIPVHKLDRVPRHEIVRTFREVRALVGDVAPDVIHTSLYWANVLGRAAARLAGKPVVTTLVNTTYEPEWRRDDPHLTPLKLAAARALEGITARRWGTRFVAVSETVRASAVRRLGLRPDLISIIPRGVETENLSPNAEQVAAVRGQLGPDGVSPLIVSVGRLVPQKGHRHAIEAMVDVTKAFPRALLVVVGEGHLRPELERLVRSRGLGDRVRLSGERTDIPTLLAAADLFVFPSLSEGFGTALLEALGVGCACVASGIPPVIGMTDNGRVALLVEPGSPSALADGLIQLAGDRALAARMGQEAATWVRQRYDITVSTRKFELVFDALANGQPIAAGEITLGTE